MMSTGKTEMPLKTALALLVTLFCAQTALADTEFPKLTSAKSSMKECMMKCMMEKKGESREGQGKDFHHRKMQPDSQGRAHGSMYKKHHGTFFKLHSAFFNPFHVLKYEDELGLTEEQLRKLGEHKFEYKKVKIRAKADYKLALLELSHSVHSGKVEEDKIRDLAQKISKIKARLIEAVAEAKIAILHTLTSEQRGMLTPH